MNKILGFLVTEIKEKFSLKIGAIFLCVCFISTNIFGQTKTWVGAGAASGNGGTDFNTPANWNPTGTPSASDNVTITLVADAGINLSSDISVNKMKLFLAGNNKVVRFNIGSKTFTVNDSADIDILAGNPNTELHIGVSDNTSAGVINFKGYAAFGKTDQGGTGTTSNVYIDANANSKIYFSTDLLLGRLARITSGSEFGKLIFDGIGNQNFTTNNNGNFSICSFRDVVIGISNSPTVNLIGGTKGFVDPMLGNLTISNSAILNVGTSRWNRSTLGGTLALTNTSKLILSDVTGGITGSNFPSNFSTYNLDSTSTVEFNGTAQTIPGTANAVLSYGNLTLSNGNVKTLGSNVSIYRCLTLANNATMALGNFDAVLKSNNVTTAYVASVPTTPNFTYGSGRFIIERYLFPQKSWRLVSVPLLKLADDATAATINESWREGGTTLSSTGDRKSTRLNSSHSS